MNDVELEPELLAARSGVYRWLARLWLREVDHDFIRDLHLPPLRDAFQAVGGTVPDDDPATVAELAVDYCQLFLGPANHLPPFQSVWQSGHFHGNSVVSMKQFVKIIGYDTGSVPIGMCLDQLGVQFDVMAYLLEQLPACESEDVNAAFELSRSYFNTHLRWPEALLDLAQRQAASDFYRSVTALTRDFLDSELDAITTA